MSHTGNGTAGSQLDDSRSIWAKPFPTATTEEKVRKVFQHLGRITAVRLRREPHTDAFRGSVYVEFESISGASSAVAHPPCQHKSHERLQIMFKADYDQKRASSAATPGKSSSKSSHGAGSRHEHGGKGSSRQSGQHTAGAAPTSGTKRSHGEASGGSWQQGGQQHQQQQQMSAPQFVPPLPPPPPNGQAWAGMGGPPGGGPVDGRLAEMQQQLEQAHHRTEAAMARADAAEGRESSVAARLFAKEIEMGALKGEVAVMKDQHASKVGLLTLRHQQVVMELESKLQRARDENLAAAAGSKAAAGRREREERERAPVAAAAAAAAARKPSTPPVITDDEDL